MAARFLCVAAGLVVGSASCSALHHDRFKAHVRAYPADSSRPYRLAVVDFEDATPGGGTHAHEEGDALAHAHGVIFADAMTAALIGLPEHEVVERREVRRIIEQIGESQLAGFDTEEIGRALELDGLVFGTVSAFSESEHLGSLHGRVSASARLVHIDSGAVLWTASAQLAAHGSVDQVASDVAEGMVTEVRKRMSGH